MGHPRTLACYRGNSLLNFKWRSDPARMVTNAIIATNIAIYALEHTLVPGLTNSLILYNWDVAQGQWCVA
jgi:hypothetical protein